ncbi:MAG: oxidoreductase [Bdellovibrionales bacterium]|nr:oxidoreductase [Bdellovibrionales bacterium]
MKQKKVILITGASSGIGKKTAEKLIAAGHVVYGGARRVERMQDLEKLGGYPLHLDVSDDASMKAAVDKVVVEQGGIDVLVNNAGFGLYGSVEDTDINDARYQFEVNLFGLARMTQLVTPHMRKRKSGKIINISSVAGKIYTPLGGWYHATKHALEGLSDCLRFELKPFGIDVVIVEPGVIQTEFGDVLTSTLMKRSEGGAYEALARQIADTTEEMYKNGVGSSPDLISGTIMKAIESKKPRTRYLVGKLAKPMLFLRNWLGDRIYDKALMAHLKSS